MREDPDNHRRLFDRGDDLQLAAIEEPAVIVKILTHLGLPARAPPRIPARRLPLFETA